MLINCKQKSIDKLNKIKNELKGFTDNKHVTIIQWNDLKSSDVYVKNMVKKINECDINCNVIKLKEDTDILEVKRLIQQYNLDDNCVGIMIQFPLFDKCDKFKESITQTISPLKDIDGLTDNRKVAIYNGSNKYLPCTVQSIVDALDGLNYNNVLIIGRSDIIGKPLIHAMLNLNKNVLVAHSKTTRNDLDKLIAVSDVIVCATGSYGVIEGFNLDNKIIIDAGISFKDNKLVGDASEEHKQLASWHTSVPNGIGLLTTTNVIGNIKKLIIGGE